MTRNQPQRQEIDNLPVSVRLDCSPLRSASSQWHQSGQTAASHWRAYSWWTVIPLIASRLHGKFLSFPERGQKGNQKKNSLKEFISNYFSSHGLESSIRIKRINKNCKLTPMFRYLTASANFCQFPFIERSLLWQLVKKIVKIIHCTV